jgi:hypothetical protein
MTDEKVGRQCAERLQRRADIGDMFRSGSRKRSRIAEACSRNVERDGARKFAHRRLNLVPGQGRAAEAMKEENSGRSLADVMDIQPPSAADLDQPLGPRINVKPGFCHGGTSTLRIRYFRRTIMLRNSCEQIEFAHTLRVRTLARRG